ncbi:MAG: accessory factor UbiK family protein [Rhodospirillales bacterium]
MQTQNKIFDDLARVANGAVSTLTGMKDEIDALIRQRLERYLNNADLVTRDEFDAVKAMAQKARTENEKLEARIKTLEGELAKAKKPAARKSAAAKSKSGTPAKTAKKPSTGARK